MKQKPWDRYEAALLLSYCLKIEAGDIPRKEAVDIVSNTLRKRAEVQGVEIDETFRNTNGISMQMSAIRNCYLGKDHGLAGSKLFHEMVDLYKSNHDALEQILQGESDKVNRSIWQEFLLWLKEAVPDKEKEIVTSLAAVSMLALKSNRTHMPISEISDVAEIERLQSIMRKPGALGLHSKKMLTKASHALNTYVQFLDKKADDAAAPEESQSVSVEESVAHANFRVDFSKSISYAHTKPISCKYKGRDISCAGWNALFINLTRLIYQECGDTFPVGCSLLSSSRIDIGNAEGMNYPKEIANGVYLECNASATGIVNKLHALFDICGINYDDVIIEYCKTSDNIVSEKEVKASNPQVAALEKLLSKHYKYGFRLGSPIELMRIRNFAEEDGIFLADSDEELERKIAATGIKIDGKVFIIESEILSGIAAVTDSVFDEGATVIFLNQLMEIKEEWLSEQHITNVDMLKTLLKRIRPNYYYGQNIITPGEKSTEHDAIVKEILRISTGQSVVRTDALKEKLPYIPTEKIAWSLSTSPEFIWISEGKYFLMNQFVLSEEDANTISEHVANECELNGYASITDLPLGNIQEENYELSETAIYAAVYSTVLKEHYYLHGKILTKEENGVDISALLKAYCAGKSCCTASELMERAEELTGTPNKQTSMAILYDSMIRVDMDEFVSEDQIHFDTNAVDTLLKSMVGTRFAPIRSVNTFALFPSCGASWNHYVLESFCYRFSEEYRLAVINYNDKNAGLIVSKDLTLSYADMLSEAAANSSVELTLESVGQYFFDNGYTAKRRCNLTAFVLGFLLKEYKGDPFRSQDSEGLRESMTPDKLSEMIGNYYSKKAKTTYIVSLTPEEKSFYELTEKAWRITPNTCTSPTQASSLIQAKMRDFVYPVWTLEEVDNTGVYDIVKKYIALIQSDGKAAHTIAIEIGKIGMQRSSCGDHLQALLTADNCLNGMSLFIQHFEGGKLSTLAKEIGASDHVLSDIKKLFSVKHAAQWIASTGEDEIRKLTVEYSFVKVTNALLNVSKDSKEGAFKSWRELLKFLGLSCESIQAKYPALNNLFTLLLKIVNYEDILPDNMKMLRDELTIHNTEMHDLLSSPLNSFIDLYAPYLTGFSHEECEIIKNSITEDMFVLSATKGNAVVKKAADDYRKGQVKDQLFRLWSERTGGTKSPKHWSEHYKTPILCCIDPEIYGEAKKAFAVLNSSQHSESEIKMALEFCEGADFFDVIADSDYRNKCFMEQIVGCYSKLLPDITAIRSALEDTDIAPYDWADDPRIKAKIKNMASVEYNAGGSDAAINTIESMPIDQLKTWLKQLAVSDMELGVKIISNGGKNA